MARLLLMLLGLWIGITLIMFALARANGQPAIPAQILSQSFYYTAIAFAVYHLLTRNKRRNN